MNHVSSRESLKNLWQAFGEAWRKVTRFRLARGSEAGEGAEPPAVDMMLPVVGLLLGVMQWILVLVIAFLVPVPVGVAICAALIIPVLYWWMTLGRGFLGMANVIANWNYPLSSGGEPFRVYLPIFIVNALVLLKAVGIALLVYHHLAAWLILVPILGITAYGEAGKSRNGGHPVPWYLAALAAVGAAAIMNLLIAGLLAAVLAWALNPALRRWMAAHSGDTPSHGLGAVMEITELVVLWVGVLAL